MRNPDLFSHFNKNTLDHARYFLLKYRDFLKWPNKPANILEVGCAAGNITQEVLFPFLKNHVNHLLATDISNDAIQLAKKNNKNPKLSFEQLDITNEGQCENYFGKFHNIFAFYCFQLIHETDLWSKNVSKMLKPGGQLYTHMVVDRILYNDVLMEQKADTTKPWWKYIKSKPNQFVDYGPKPMESITNILADVGLDVKNIDCEQKICSFSDINDVRGTFIAMNPYSTFIPEIMKNAYMEDYVNKSMKYVKVSDSGDIFFPLNVLSVLATKT